MPSLRPARRQCAMRVEYPAQRQNCEHLRREESIGHRHAELAAAHPVVVILRVCTDFIRKARIGLLALIECLDDFMPATWSTMVSFNLPLEVSMTVPRGSRGSLARSFSRMVFKIPKVALCEMPSALL